MDHDAHRGPPTDDNGVVLSNNGLQLTVLYTTIIARGVYLFEDEVASPLNV